VDAAIIVAAVSVGASTLAGLLAWSLGRNVTLLDRRMDAHDLSLAAHAKENADLRVAMERCVQRQSFDEFKEELRRDMGDLREQNARILARLEQQ
jgi:hypothetical protein